MYCFLRLAAVNVGITLGPKPSLPEGQFSKGGGLAKLLTAMAFWQHRTLSQSVIYAMLFLIMMDRAGCCPSEVRIIGGNVVC